MRQPQFDALLAWSMMNALNLAVLVNQNQMGRPLTDEEFLDCHRKTHQAAQAMQGFLRENRKGSMQQG